MVGLFLSCWVYSYVCEEIYEKMAVLLNGLSFIELLLCVELIHFLFQVR